MEHRHIDDYLPRANLKKMFQASDISSSDQASVTEFLNKYIVEEEFILKYLKHLEMLDLKKRKRLEKKEMP